MDDEKRYDDMISEIETEELDEVQAEEESELETAANEAEVIPAVEETEAEETVEAEEESEVEETTEAEEATEAEETVEAEEVAETEEESEVEEATEAEETTETEETTEVAEETEAEEVAEVEETSETEETTEGEISESEQAPATEVEKKEPSKAALFFKKNRKWFILAAVVVLIIVGAIAGYFIAVRNMVFVRDADDLVSALAENKGEIVILKKDVTVDGDVVFGKAYEIDLEGHTLTVNGTLSMTLGEDNSTIVVHTDKKKLDESAGIVKAQKLVLNGANATWNFLSELDANVIELHAYSVNFNALTASELTANLAMDMTFAQGVKNANDAADVTVNKCNTFTVNGAIQGDVTLDKEKAKATVFNSGSSANDVTGGAHIIVCDGATVASVTGSATLVVAPSATVTTIYRVDSVVLQEKLSTPIQVTFVEQNNGFLANVAAVRNATKYVWQVVDANGSLLFDGSSASSTGIDVSNSESAHLDPGTYTFRVQAANDDTKYVASEWLSREFTYSVKLSVPVASIAEVAGALLMSITPVENADYYIVSVNGVVFNERVTDVTTALDVSSAITGVGDYSFTVQAASDNPAYQASDVSLYDYTKVETFVAVTFDDTLWSEEGFDGAISWTGDEHSNYYRITVKPKFDPAATPDVVTPYGTYYTTETEITIDIPTKSVLVGEEQIAVSMVYGTDYEIEIISVPYAYYE